ncbi:MAG: aldo/keto reductase [Chloroflexi bacterium CFX1]|nr:putative oxidoreductase [Anaerolineales bacterium]MCE7920729.1 aldo/keto reductase [Chloroflexi bacterium CFX1]MDL1920300.1 aldo/keto reductase [Chloroflexi bacterium CFX5]NUQ58697.1 aldo/keto reductase [Anaerolineales bacterium]
MNEVSNETRFLHAVEMGLGAWQWGDRIIWGYQPGQSDQSAREAFEVSLSLGIRFVDTAEIYGSGRSERLLGEFLKTTDQPVLTATKFFPWPWRLAKGALPRALKGSLERIGLESVDLYQIHWPTPLMTPETMMEGMAECVKQGLARTVGVSNFWEKNMIRAYSALARRGVPLASNQLPFSLLNRAAEKNGTLARCKELGARFIAYSPLAQGLLTGKYSIENPPPGLRGSTYGETLKKLPPVIQALREIAQAHGKTISQTALNWIICKGALPIPGAKNAKQAEDNAGGAGWRMTDDEVAKLDEVTNQFTG